MSGVRGGTAKVAKQGGISLSPTRYPKVRRDEDAKWEPRPGRFVKEPYSYLEDPDAKETEDFVKQQNELTDSVLESLPAREDYKALMTSLMDYPKTSVPKKKGKRWYYYYNTGLQAQNVLFSQSGEEASPDHSSSVVLLDPNELSDDGTVALASAAFSDDGQKLAYATSSGGSDWVQVRYVSRFGFSFLFYFLLTLALLDPV